jgi:hypothetical protein
MSRLLWHISTRSSSRVFDVKSLDRGMRKLVNKPENLNIAAITAYKTNRCLVKPKPDSTSVWSLKSSRTCQKLDNRILWSYISEESTKQGRPDYSYTVSPKFFHRDAFSRVL